MVNWMGSEETSSAGRDMSVMFGTVVMATQHSFLRNMTLYTRKYPCTILVVMKCFGKSNVFVSNFFAFFFLGMTSGTVLTVNFNVYFENKN